MVLRRNAEWYAVKLEIPNTTWKALCDALERKVLGYDLMYTAINSKPDLVVVVIQKKKKKDVPQRNAVQCNIISRLELWVIPNLIDQIKEFIFLHKGIRELDD